jgi:pyruvate,water dikinase
VGRLRRSLPHLALDAVRRTDAALRAVPALGGLSDDELLETLGRTREELIRVHAYQMLAGMLLPAAADRTSASALALSTIAAARRSGTDDVVLVATAPVVLALVPPRIGPLAPLPPAPSVAGAEPPAGVGDLGPREALRLRARWLDELAARIAWTLGERLAARRRLPEPAAVAHLTLDELADAITDPAREVRPRSEEALLPPLPATFRLTAAGDVVPVPPVDARRTSSMPRGRGAAGGRAVGPVRHEGSTTSPGDVLVVRVLSPGLAGGLPTLGALVSETGSTLSHLAILAREMGVPTVVGLAGATERFPEGSRVLVDGDLGEVRMTDDPREVRA